MLTMKTDDVGIIVIKASGRLSKADCERFVPEFERIVRARGPMRILIELDDLHGWDLPGPRQALKFDTRTRAAWVAPRLSATEPGRNGATAFEAVFQGGDALFERDQAADARVWRTGPRQSAGSWLGVPGPVRVGFGRPDLFV